MQRKTFTQAARSESFWARPARRVTKNAGKQAVRDNNIPVLVLEPNCLL